MDLNWIAKGVVEDLRKLTKKKTNGDRIRSMNDQELANFLEDVETQGRYDRSVSGSLEMIEWIQSKVGIANGEEV